MGQRLWRWGLWALLSAWTATAAAQSADSTALAGRLGLLTPAQREDVLWLARCVYSESDLEHEQRLVAWVVRNRVETAYRGATYREVVLEPYQFSAFNHPNARRAHILGLTLESASRAWRQAARAALDVYLAPPEARPFAPTTRHFFSPVSMRGRKQPHWAVGETALDSEGLGISPVRFQFYAGIDRGRDAPRLASAMEAADAAPPPPAARETPAEHIARRKSSSARSVRLSGRVARPVRPKAARPGRTRTEMAPWGALRGE